MLQFLVCVQELSYQTNYLEDIQYRQVTFPVQHFLEYKKESNNYYQVKKILQFFDELQTNSMIKFFTNNYYRSLITIPDVKLFPGKQNRWTAKVWIAEELFCCEGTEIMLKNAQLQKKFKHAKNFRLLGSCNRANVTAYKKKINRTS